MNQTYYVRRQGKILGPFPVGQLEVLKHRGILTAAEEVSPDKINWRPATILTNLFPPVAPPTPNWEAMPAVSQDPLVQPLQPLDMPLPAQPFQVQPQPVPVQPYVVQPVSVQPVEVMPQTTPPQNYYPPVAQAQPPQPPNYYQQPPVPPAKPLQQPPPRFNQAQPPQYRPTMQEQASFGTEPEVELVFDGPAAQGDEMETLALELPPPEASDGFNGIFGNGGSW